MEVGTKGGTDGVFDSHITTVQGAGVHGHFRVTIEEKNKFRAATTRPKIVYSVQEYEGREIEAVGQLVEEKCKQYPAPAKIIIYSSTIEGTKQLREKLGCHAYYRAVGDTEAKDEIRKQWQSGDGRVIVAKNAFGLGIDEPDVRVVIHAGPIYQMRNYGQESGWAGRDGRPCQAIIMKPTGMQEVLQQKYQRMRQRPAKRTYVDEKAEKQIEWEKCEQFISGERCRRIYLDQEMDGRLDRSRCEEGEIRCDVCQKDDQQAEALERMRQEYIRSISTAPSIFHPACPYLIHRRYPGTNRHSVRLRCQRASRHLVHPSCRHIFDSR